MTGRCWLWVVMLAAAACSSPAPGDAGWVPPSVRGVSDPLAVATLRLSEAEGLIDRSAAGGADAGTANSRLKTLVREIAGLMGDASLDPWPITRATLRTRALFIYSGDETERRKALAECHRLSRRLRKALDAKKRSPKPASAYRGARGGSS